MTVEDRKILDLKESKNNLETLCYSYRENLSEYGNWEKYIEASVRTAMLKNVAETVEWLYAEGENSTYEEYTKRIQAFKATGEPAKKRYIFYTSIDDCFKRFEELVTRSDVSVASIDYLTDDQKTIVKGKLGLGHEMINALKKEIETKPKHEDPSTTIEAVDKKIDLLAAELKAIFSTPPPKVEVPEEEEKKEEPAAETE